MDLGLNGRHALITGASKGIGLACADVLAAEGCSLTLAARTQSELERAAAELTQRHSVTVEIQALDLSRTENLHALWSASGNPDILVNNAGAIPPGSINDVDEASWREAWDLKVFGYIDLMRLAYADMQNRGNGVIVNVIGAGGERPSAGYAAGAGGNAALMALTRAMGGRSMDHGVRVVGINPGLIETERMETGMRKRAAKRFGDPERWPELLASIKPAPGKPKHIADMVAFLASDLSANTTGTIVTIDGGHCAR